MEYQKNLLVWVLIVSILYYFSVAPVLAGQPALDGTYREDRHVPQSRFSSEIDIPLSDDQDKGRWTKKNTWALIISAALLAGGAALVGAQAVNGDDTDAVPHSDTGGVKGSW